VKYFGNATIELFSVRCTGGNPSIYTHTISSKELKSKYTNKITRKMLRNASGTLFKDL